jgi:WD40 repeat protein
MGVVYKARHLALKRTVALKIMLAGGHAGSQELARFQIEAEAVARLQHPNIVQIHEVGAAGGYPYCALEFVEGGNLASKLGGKPLPAREAARLVEALARAMQLAHSRNVVHRDLKPANVLLTAAGTPKVTDFGLARQLDSATGQTQPGALMGTPNYMAPEQASGRAHEAGPAADVYALGTLLYECLTGRPPFQGKTVMAILDQVRTREPAPPSRCQPTVPRDLETICLKCLHKQPEQRYASAQALAEDLHRWQTGEPITARPTGWLERTVKWARRRPAQAGLVLLALLLLLGLVAGGVGLFAYQAIKTEKEIAEQKRDEAQTERDRAEKAEKKLEKQAYYSWVQRALPEWKLRGPVEAQKLLDQCKSELRGWEYHYVRRLCRGSKLTIQVNSGPLTCVCFSPDGKWIAGGMAVLEEKPVGSVPGAIKLWDAGTGKEGLSIRSPAGPVQGVSFSSDGKHILGVSGPRTVKVWDARTGRQELSFDGSADFVFRVRFSPDGQRIAVASQGQPIKLWDARTGQEILSLKGTAAVRTTDLSFSPDGKRLAGACSDQTVKVWDVQLGQEGLILKGFSGAVSNVSYSPDGERIAAGGSIQEGELVNAVKVWDAETGKETLTLRGHPDPITGVSFSPDSKRLASVSGDRMSPSNKLREVKVWDVRTGEEILAHRGHSSGLWDVCFSPDGKHLATVGSGWNEMGAHDLRKGEVRIWNAPVGQEALTFRGHVGFVVHASFGPDGSQVASLCPGEEMVRLWDAWTGEEARTLRGHSGLVFSACFSPASQPIATSGQDQTVKIWDARTGRQTLSFQEQSAPVAGVCWSSDGSRIAGILGEPGLPDKPGVVKVWDARNGAEVVTLKGHSAQITDVCFSPEGDRIASAGRDSMVKVWDARTGQQVLSLRGPPGHCHAVRFSPDGQQIASGHGDATVRVWDAKTGEEVLTLSKGHFGSVLCVCFSPDGNRIVSGGSDQTVRVWDAKTGQEALTLKGHSSDVRTVQFSPDGKRLASASQDQTVKIWDGGSDE